MHNIKIDCRTGQRIKLKNTSEEDITHLAMIQSIQDTISTARQEEADRVAIIVQAKMQTIKTLAAATSIDEQDLIDLLV